MVAQDLDQLPSESTGRRYRGQSPEERRADQRNRLVRAAIDEFAARGFHKTSVEDIVRARQDEPHRVLRVLRQPRGRDVRRAPDTLRDLLADVRSAIFQAGPDDDLVEVGIGAYVEHLVADPAAATIVCSKASARPPR